LKFFYLGHLKNFYTIQYNTKRSQIRFWGALQQLVYRPHRIRDVEHLKEVLQTCGEQIGQEDVIDREETFASDCRSLLQPVEDTMSTALTNVFGATRTLSHLTFLL